MVAKHIEMSGWHGRLPSRFSMRAAIVNIANYPSFGQLACTFRPTNLQWLGR
jgi:hypothetical protein